MPSFGEADSGRNQTTPKITCEAHIEASMNSISVYYLVHLGYAYVVHLGWEKIVKQSSSVFLLN